MLTSIKFQWQLTSGGIYHHIKLYCNVLGIGNVMPLWSPHGQTDIHTQPQYKFLRSLTAQLNKLTKHHDLHPLHEDDDEVGLTKTLDTSKRLHRFDFIECFLTTFLHAHSWLNWVNDYTEMRSEAPGWIRFPTLPLLGQILEQGSPNCT